MPHNFTMEERRELYKAMRSAHDGICPMCGGEVMQLANSSYWCRNRNSHCDFELDVPEVHLIRSWHGDFHHNLPTLIRQLHATEL